MSGEEMAGGVPAENDFTTEGRHLGPAALAFKKSIESDPSARSDHMAYLPDMERIDPSVRQRVVAEMDAYDPSSYQARDVARALSRGTCTLDDLKALLSPAAEPFLERMAQRARRATRRHFGNSTYLFTPLYLANYCENYCVYCGFNCFNRIKRVRLDDDRMAREMDVIADSGIEEILLLTGESPAKSDVSYIGRACRLARTRFRNVGLEVYPMNVDEYRLLHGCGADFVTVFQETYDRAVYERLHLMGRKRVWPYRFEAQERALMAGMRGVGFSALLGLADFRKDAFATALHASLLQSRYPHAEISLSCPRLRPIVNNGSISPLDVHERQLCQVLCAYRIFMPYAGIVVSSRETARFRDGIVKMAATKVSAGVSTGIGEHEEKYTGRQTDAEGDEQFIIADSRSLDEMRRALVAEGMQPVLNDYIYA